MLTDEQKKLLTEAFTDKVRDELTVELTESLASKAGICKRFVEIFAIEKGIIPLRYARNVGSIGLDGQKRLLESSCLVIGLGGLGGFLCEALARAGVGWIFAVDKDAFDQTNLNRQLFCTENNLGEQKAKEAENRIKQVNNSIEFTAFATPFSEVPQNIWNDVRLVFDCLDNIKDRLILAQKCSQSNVPLVHGAIAGWCGEIATIWPASRLLDKIYKTDTKGIEQNLGTPVFTAATTAGIMASVGIKILTEKTQKKDNRILYFDLMENIWQTVNL